MSTRLAAATSGRPFSNGTEGEAWRSRWCEVCTHDHSMHGPDPEGPGCMILVGSMVGDPWPEAWLPEPDDGEFHLPSRMICGSFQPCTDDACDGDEWPDVRAALVASTTAWWIEHGNEAKS